jgi:hypothetical protein
MALINEYRKSINDFIRQDLNKFAKRCRETWNGNGELMARDLAGYMDNPPSPVTCRNWMNGAHDIKHSNVAAVRYVMRLKRADALQAEIDNHKSTLEALRRARNAI